MAHHERFDGSGYPVGVTGQDIPLCGRIVALADVYDALTSKRVYKEAFDHHVAHSMICEETGKHFDPDVVDAFVEREDEFLAIRRRFAEPEMVPV
ncbi:MAG: HD domain-containing phosphohydrolase [Planctomycetota bacterium]